MGNLKRKLERQRAKELMKKMNIKKRVFILVLSDKKTIVTVHSPSMQLFTQYLDSFGVISQIGNAFSAVQNSQGNVNLTSVHIDERQMEDFYPLLAALSTYRELISPLGERDMAKLDDIEFMGPSQVVTTDDYKGLSIDDGMAIMLGYVKLLAPESLANPTKAEAPLIQEPVTA